MAELAGSEREVRCDLAGEQLQCQAGMQCVVRVEG